MDTPQQGPSPYMFNTDSSPKTQTSTFYLEVFRQNTATEGSCEAALFCLKSENEGLIQHSTCVFRHAFSSFCFQKDLVGQNSNQQCYAGF